MAEKIIKTDAEWRAQLTPEQYAVTRQKATERPYTGEYDKTDVPGTYRCVCCGEVLFESGRQIRFRLRLAELRQARRCHRRREGPQPWHGACRGAVREMRRASGPCLQ